MQAESSLQAIGRWDRLWHHKPSDAKDAQLLAREERSPRWHAALEAVRNRFGSIRGLRTMELGSGRGDLSALLARRGAKVTLLDASALALAQARSRFRRIGLDAEFEQADLFDEIHRLRGAFDVTLSSGVVEHFGGGDRTRALRAHLEALRPGGLAIISVPHAGCVPYRLWKTYLELRGCWPYGLEIPYSKREMIRRGREAGFTGGRVCCSGFWHSVSAQWGRSVFGLNVDWSGRPSVLDPLMGLILLYIARRPS